MNFFDMSVEEIREWRQHPVTVAYFEELRSHMTNERNHVVEAMNDESDISVNRARRIAGMVSGFEKAIQIMETDK